MRYCDFSDRDFLAKHVCRRPFKDGDIVMREGEEADSFFIITAGSLTVQKDGITLWERRPYELIGEQALIDRTVRSATLIARGRVELLEIGQTAFEKMLQCSPQFARNLLGILSGKLREATDERGVRYGREERLQEMFGQHLSKEQLEELLLAPDLDTYLVPQRVEATVLYSDIRGFTTASEHLDPKDLADQLNAYLGSVVNSVFGHRGMIDRFIGDAVLAVFGIPTKEEDDTERAIRCALEMALHIAIGIEIGHLVVSRLGKKGDRDIICLGESVYQAEGTQNRADGKETRISESVYGYIEDDDLKDLFKKSTNGPSEYVTTKTINSLWAAQRTQNYEDGEDAVISETGIITPAVYAKEEKTSRPIPNTRPWAQ